MSSTTFATTETRTAPRKIIFDAIPESNTQDFGTPCCRTLVIGWSHLGMGGSIDSAAATAAISTGSEEHTASAHLRQRRQGQHHARSSSTQSPNRTHMISGHRAAERWLLVGHILAWAAASTRLLQLPAISTGSEEHTASVHLRRWRQGQDHARSSSTQSPNRTHRISGHRAAESGQSREEKCTSEFECLDRMAKRCGE